MMGLQADTPLQCLSKLQLSSADFACFRFAARSVAIVFLAIVREPKLSFLCRAESRNARFGVGRASVVSLLLVM
jgi:hypothetical protein